MIGSALTEPKGYLSLGASATMGTLEETTATSPYEDLVDATKRAEILSSNKKTYNANSMNLGAMIRFPKKINPTIAIVARDMGNTKNTPTKSGESSLVTKEDLTLGFGIAPSVGKVGRFNLNAEGARLTDTDAPSRKKYRIGTEFTLGSQEGSRALLGLRTGYNSGGVSYGAHLNLGLISVEIASQAVDIGGMDSPVVERRTSGVVYIDVGSF